MTITHSVKCGRCGANAEPLYIDQCFAAPRGWLSVSYSIVDKNGAYVVVEDRHACSDCAQGVLDALNKAV